MARSKRYRGPRSSLEAHQENRKGKVLKVFRNMAEDDVSRIGGILQELSRSEDIPPINTPTKAAVYLLDPRTLNRNIIRGMVTGVELGKLSARVNRAEELPYQGYEVGLDVPYLLSERRRTVLVPLKSEVLKEEIASINRILAEEKIPGFSHGGTIKGHRERTPAVVIGNFKQPVSKEVEADVIDAIDVGLDRLAVGGLGRSVQLGELSAVQYKF